MTAMATCNITTSATASATNSATAASACSIADSADSVASSTAYVGSAEKRHWRRQWRRQWRRRAGYARRPSVALLCTQPIQRIGIILLIREERVHRLLGHLGTALRKPIGRVRIGLVQRIVDGQAEQGARHVVRTKAWEEPEDLQCDTRHERRRHRRAREDARNVSRAVRRDGGEDLRAWGKEVDA